MSSRAAVFASIRRSLGVTGDEATRQFEVETRLKQAPPGIVPKRGQGDVPARLATFKAEAERAQTSVTEVKEWADAPAEIARYLRESNCPATLRMGDDPRLTDMPWSDTTLEILRGPSDGHDLNAVSAAFAGIAETGTLALVSGPGQSDNSQFSARQPHRPPAARGDRGRLRERVRQSAERLRQGRSAAHGQFYNRAFAISRYRADVVAWRAWAPTTAYRRGRLNSCDLAPQCELTAC